MRSIDELIDNDKSAGRQFLLEGAVGRQRNQVVDPGPLKHIDIGAVVDIGGRQPVTFVVPRQKNDLQAGVGAAAQRRRRLAPLAISPRRGHLQARQIIKDAGCADNAEYGLCHDVFAVSGSQHYECSTILRGNNLRAGSVPRPRCSLTKVTPLSTTIRFQQSPGTKHFRRDDTGYDAPPLSNPPV
jgi:hypothetical protein